MVEYIGVGVTSAPPPGGPVWFLVADNVGNDAGAEGAEGADWIVEYIGVGVASGAWFFSAMLVSGFEELRGTASSFGVAGSFLDLPLPCLEGEETPGAVPFKIAFLDSSGWMRAGSVGLASATATPAGIASAGKTPEYTTLGGPAAAVRISTCAGSAPRIVWMTGCCVSWVIWNDSETTTAWAESVITMAKLSKAVMEALGFQFRRPTLSTCTARHFLVNKSRFHLIVDFRYLYLQSFLQ
ncbi:uncharacterized protein BDZ83DRAFT_341995 [Colletotrichum acutatum]|uniref:Uncharacterized protein n=1 Tax=Glomerella acutata TaxID=27357 RepID=A0AAD8XNP7_GLOAC|nr:uncharacterized protein BDZ83DRAFT_341995 [Colletotrichum acutatum]KAK1730832.1 hypothetical protein BDZ83DRAFT_341995 [Colletotrichum acutatum]